jgi:hypothetical protein
MIQAFQVNKSPIGYYYNDDVPDSTRLACRIGEANRHAASFRPAVRMDRETQDLGALGGFLIELIELVAGALQKNIGMTMLHHHDRDIVQLYRVSFGN